MAYKNIYVQTQYATGRIGFMAGQASTLSSVTSGSAVVFNSVYRNDGNHYNTATGIFTAPANGYYYFKTTILHQNVSNGFSVDSQIARNNTTGLGYYNLMERKKYQADYTGHTGYLSENGSALFYLSALDNVRVKYGGAQSTTIHGNPGWSNFSGFLVST